MPDEKVNNEGSPDPHGFPAGRHKPSLERWSPRTTFQATRRQSENKGPPQGWARARLWGASRAPTYLLAEAGDLATITAFL